MRIDQIKSPKLFAAVMSIALTASVVGCVGGSDKEGSVTRISQIPAPSTVAPPQRCSISAEAIRPPSLSRENVATYPGGIVVNMAGNIADISVNESDLRRLNNDPTLGLSVPGYTNILYFFQGSFSRPDAVSQMNAFFEAQKFYLSARYCEGQGEPLNNVLRTSLSMGDARDRVTQTNPSLQLGSRRWVSELERDLAIAYIRRTRSIVDSGLNRPITQLSDTTVDRALAAGLPFRIIRFTPSPQLI